MRCRISCCSDQPALVVGELHFRETPDVGKAGRLSDDEVGGFHGLRRFRRDAGENAWLSVRRRVQSGKSAASAILSALAFGWIRTGLSGSGERSGRLRYESCETRVASSPFNCCPPSMAQRSAPPAPTKFQAATRGASLCRATPLGRRSRRTDRAFRKSSIVNANRERTLLGLGDDCADLSRAT